MQRPTAILSFCEWCRRLPIAERKRLSDDNVWWCHSVLKMTPPLTKANKNTKSRGWRGLWKEKNKKTERTSLNTESLRLLCNITLLELIELIVTATGAASLAIQHFSVVTSSSISRTHTLKSLLMYGWDVTFLFCWQAVLSKKSALATLALL